MMTARTQGYRPGLVDMATGRISREIFVNEEIYREELERVFARAWLFIGHESQIPNPGDFFVSGMGEESVILCRDRAGEIHVFLNSCRHRGMKVCRYDEGNTPVFTCPYHGWSYGTDGKLVGVPYFREAYHSELDRSQWGLVEVAQLCNYKGGIWAEDRDRGTPRGIAPPTPPGIRVRTTAVRSG
jgi:phenylpropionate dioxygenase-like ring-hydroxylating dioxygenase large terminal subunit